MTFVAFFAIGAACGWQAGNTIRRLIAGTPLRWIDWAAAATWAATVVVSML